MSVTERLTVGVVLTVLLFLVPAFVLHTSPRFAGSLAGFVIGTAATTLMVSILIYPLAKYSARVRSWIIGIMSMRALLAFHVYAGIFAAFLAILHTGHNYQSPLGISLVISMLIVVVTGFVGWYYLPHTTTELRDAQGRLATLRSVYDRTAIMLTDQQAPEEGAASLSARVHPDVPIRQVIDGIADLEYAIGSRATVKRLFMWWTVAHVVAAIVMYLLLTLHIAGEVYYGLRWLS